MKQPLRVGVIGVGHLGRHHARIYQELPMVSLVGVVDINRSRGTTIGQEFGVPHFENLTDLFPLVSNTSGMMSASLQSSASIPELRRENDFKFSHESRDCF